MTISYHKPAKPPIPDRQDPDELRTTDGLRRWAGRWTALAGSVPRTTPVRLRGSVRSPLDMAPAPCGNVAHPSSTREAVGHETRRDIGKIGEQPVDSHSNQEELEKILEAVDSSR